MYFRLVLLLALVPLVGSATASGRTDGAGSARILFASDSTAAFGEHIDVVAVDERGRLRRVDDLGPGSFAAPSPDGSHIAFLHEEADDDGVQLYVMNRDGSEKRQLTEEPDVALAALLWSPNGRFVIFGRLGPRIGIAAADGTTVRYIDTPYAVSPTWSPDGKTIAYTTQAQTEPLYLADADGRRVRRIGVGSSPQWSPDGRQLVVVRNRQLWIVEPETREKRRLRHGELEAPTAVWSPDGSRLAFIGSMSSNVSKATGLWTLELASGRLRRLTRAPVDASAPSWSRDGRWLAFVGDRGFVWVVSALRGGVARTLGSWPPRRAAGLPHWLGSGRLVLSTAVTENDPEIFVTNPDGTGVRALTNNEAADTEPSGSADGESIAYVSTPRKGGKRAIYLMRSDGSSNRPLLSPDFPPQSAPAWSPAGTEIAFEARRHIYLVDVAGGTPRQLIRGSEPAWAPDAQTLAFHGTFEGRKGVWLINRNRTGLRRAPGFRLPSLAPDAAQLAFQRPVERDANGVFVADLATESERLLVRGRDPAWSPDGTSIAYDTRVAIWTTSSTGDQRTPVTTLNGTSEHAAWLPAAPP